MALYISLLIVSFAIYMWTDLRKQIHMLQLNSYRNERYFDWMKDQKRVEASYLMFGLIISNLALNKMLTPNVYLLMHTTLFLVMRIIHKKHQEKKPLVFTWRVRRLLLTFTLLCAVMLLGLCYLFRATVTYDITFLVGIVNLFLPAMILLSNKINQPFEKKIALDFTKDAMERLSAAPELKIIGITGSYGKTSTKYILNQLLSVGYQVLMTPESFNTPMGVVRTIREKLNGTHQIFIVEMGAKNIGDIKEICDIVSPDMGIISSIGEQHLETFKTIDNVIETKYELAEAVGSKKGTMFLNYNNEYIRRQKLSTPVVRYGVANGTENPLKHYDVWAENLSSGPNGSTFDICQPGGKRMAFETRLLGPHNVQNIVAGTAVAMALGISLEKLAPAVRRLEPVPHRLHLLKNPGRYQIIDDAFNANPEGAKAAVETLGTFKGFRVLVTPGMVELGEKEESLNREFGGQAAKYCDYIILVGYHRAKPIKEGALKAGFSEENIYIAKDIYDALKMADNLANGLKPEEGPMYVLLENDLPDNFLEA
ncbi:MAG TPA: UDP-N-acetylmuramyl peptide synthase [Peptococcaceae bacterium]|nr:UDP-N-acetylmuramyl peptide synthase [Peptococcaceae bacterium]